MIKTFCRSLATVFSNSKLLFILNFIIIIISGIISGINVYSIQQLVNGIQDAIIKGTSISKNIMLFISVNLIIIIVQNIRSYTNQMIAINLDYNLDNEYLIKCSTLDLKDFENEDVYTTITKAYSLGKLKVQDIYFNFLQLVESIISMISVIFAVRSIDSYLLGVIIIIPIFSTISSIKIGKYAYDKEKENIKHQRKSDYFSYLLTNNIAIKEIISFNIANYLIEKFKRHKDIVKNTNKSILKLHITKNILVSILEITIKVFLIVTVIIKSINNNGKIGNIMGYIYSLDLIENKLNNLLSSITEIYKSKLYVDNYYEFLDTNVGNVCKGKNLVYKKIASIEIKNLSFGYNGLKKDLSNIDLNIKKDRPIVILGTNGSGKSTLIKILAGLYDDFEGEIFVNGMSLRKINKNNYREKITVIFQDFNQYELSLRENIAFSKISHINNSKKISRTINKVGLSDVVDSFEHRLDTQMGCWFGGRELSKGQWQRIALARVLFRDADIVILDEPTSALDPIIEKEIFSLINDIAKDKILILVTHRVENIKKYDPWYVFMEKGRIVNQGLYEDIKDTSAYKKLTV